MNNTNNFGKYFINIIQIKQYTLRKGTKVNEIVGITNG